MSAPHNPGPLPLGEVVDGLRVVRYLGSGTYGHVYLVEKRGRRYALKLARRRGGSDDPAKTAARALRELICLLLLRHLHIVRVLGYGYWPDETDGYFYVLLEYVDGFTLAEWMERTHPTHQEVVRLFTRLFAALAYTHQRGVLHRDLKVTNILVRAADGEPVILDYGAGDYPLAEELTDAALPPGTARYRSPEAALFWREHRHTPGARYEFKPADDVYALGVAAYDVLTRPRPADEHSRIDVQSPLWLPPAPREVNERVPEALSALVLRLIARNPKDRPPTADAARRELEELAGHQGEEWRVPVHPPSAQVPPAPGGPAALSKVQAPPAGRRIAGVLDAPPGAEPPNEPTAVSQGVWC